MAEGHAERTGIDVGEVSLPQGHPLLKAAWGAAGVGVLALVAGLTWGWALDRGEGARFFGSYLTAWFYWLTVAVGGLFFVLLHHLTRAGWSVVVRRQAEHVAAALPVFAILFLPLVLGAGELYPWMGEEAAHDPLVAGKAGYLNPGFFYLRSALYLVVWAVLGGWFWRRSLEQDRSGDPALTRRLQTVSAPGMVAFAVTLNFASFDWVMSLDPHWYSTIFGVYVFAGSTVAILAALVLLSMVLDRRGPLAGVVTPEHYHDLGKLLFGFVVFWAYIGFSQYMLIWYGNIPEETIWYAHRLEHGWETVTVALALGHFVLPFFFLLSRDVKRRRATLGAASLWMLGAHYVDVYWLVMPAVGAEAGFHPHWLDLVNFVAVGGIALGAFGWAVSRRPLVPVADPRLPESLSFENM